MNELMVIGKQNIGEGMVQTVNARDLHAFLGVGKDFSTWIKDRIDKYEFVDGQDYVIVDVLRSPESGSSKSRTQKAIDYHLTLDMAKELAMVERNEKGKQARQYFIECERVALQPVVPSTSFALPQTFAEALRALADESEKNATLQVQIEADKPKTIFADSVAASSTSILVSELAKILKQNGHDIGGTRLFAWMRDNGYLIKRKGSEWNMPTQASMERELFEIKETTINNSSGSAALITKTVKITGKGQIYFINKFAKDKQTAGTAVAA